MFCEREKATANGDVGAAGLTRRAFARAVAASTASGLALPAASSASAATVLRAGSEGAAVRALNGRLSELTCLPTEEVSSLFTAAPRHAVVAFRKHSGLVADGAVGPITRAELRGKAPRPLLRERGKRIEVGLRRQLAFLVRDGIVHRTVAVSTGARGTKRRAVASRSIDANLGPWSFSYGVWLPWAAYFVRGIAFHGYPTSRPTAASHGCVRVPPPFAEDLYSFARIGTTVVVP